MGIGTIPKNEKDILLFTADLIEECSVSIDQRRQDAAAFRRAFYTGTVDEAFASKHNRCYSLIDAKASYLFSPSDVRCKVKFDLDEDPAWHDKAVKAGQKVSNHMGGGCTLAFSQAVEAALVERSCFIKLGCKMGKTAGIGVPNFKSFTPHVVRQGFMGVLREDLTSLDDQDAFLHQYYLTPAQFRRLLWNHPQREDLVERAMAGSNARAADDLDRDSFMYELLSSAVQGTPPVSTGAASGARGATLISSPPSAQLAADVRSTLIRVDELWVWDDEREDWTTFRIANPDIIFEGSKIQRNLSDIPGHHGFVKVCPNETIGYFWGRSELANVMNLQSVINKRVEDIDTIFHRSTNPAQAFIGFTGITEDKQNAMMYDCSHVFLDEPQGKVQDISPKMPAQYLEYLGYLDRSFDDAAGLNPMLQGRGESGVRSGAQAGQLMRTSTPRLRDQAFAVEGQYAELGDLALKCLRAKDARVIIVKGGQQFNYANLPDDATVEVDSHTSSPAFSADAVNLAFALAKAGAISSESLIEMTHPPNQDELVRLAKEREEAKEKLLAQVAQTDPQALTKMVAHQGGKR